MSIFNIDRHQYKWDTRGASVEKYTIRNVRPGQALIAECPPWIAEQIDTVFARACTRHPLKETTSREFSHGWHFADGTPGGTEAFLQLLQTSLTMPAPEHVDIAMALDWYYQPDGEGALKHTTAGYWINTTKHASEPTWSNSRKSRREMVSALVHFIETHPLYRNAAAIVTAPGHEATGHGFSEDLARDVATRAGIPYVDVTSPGPRPQQKEGAQDLTGLFTVQGKLTGDVIVLDDVYRSGRSASAVGEAARRAGATRVFALTVARTIRK